MRTVRLLERVLVERPQLSANWDLEVVLLAKVLEVCILFCLWCLINKCILSIYAPMIYTAPYVMFLMRADPLLEPVGALEIKTFLGPLKWQRALRL